MNASWLLTSGQGILDLVFPPTCAGCASPGSLLCDRCAQAVEVVTQAICPRCGRAQLPTHTGLCILCLNDAAPVLSMARAAAFHTEPLRAIIHQFKYEKQPELARPLVRYLLAAFAATDWRTIKIDVVVPIPMFAERKRERGYNQAELLARHFSAHTNLPLNTNLLQRTRFTQPQVGLNAHERLQNVEDAFEANKAVRGGSLLLIDDVYTTGATLRACASAALEKGAYQVYGLALAIPTVQ